MKKAVSDYVRGRLHLGLVCVLLLLGCSGESVDGRDLASDTTSIGDVPAEVSGEVSGEVETLGQEDHQQGGDVGEFVVGEWEVVEPGGKTGCVDGSKFRFFVRPGDPKRAVVYLQGGGACWSLMTCMMGPAMSRSDVPDLAEFKEALVNKGLAGILDMSASDHPFPDWTVVYIPYCSSDLHWGQRDNVYSDKLTVPHRGFFNATTAFDWLYEHVKNPKMLVLTGSSAGGYGILMHSAWVSQHYPSAVIRVVVDAAAGIVAGDFTAVSMEVWGASESMPKFIPEIAAADLSSLSFSGLFGAIVRYYPQHRYALYSTAYDDQQTFFFKVMGGTPEDWPGKLQEFVTALTGELSQLSVFVPAGTMHTILPFEAFYDREIDGVRFVDWLRSFALDADAPTNHNCTTPECAVDPICQACPPKEAGPRPFHCDVCESMGILD